MNRTDHSKQIEDLRAVADYYDSLSEIDFSPAKQEEYRKDALSARAASDLLEIHDSTGLNLHAAPGLLAFVEGIAPTFIGEFKVDDNHA